jgi:hypothetical protein
MPKRTHSIEDVRKFRSAIAKLKKAGLVSPLIDARKASPESRGLRDAVKRFKDVVSGRAVTLKTSRLTIPAKELRGHHLQISKPAGLPQRVIVPRFPDEKVSRGAGGVIKYVSPEGIRRLTLPKVRDDTIGHFFADLKASSVKLPDQRKGEYFAARYFSGRTKVYQSLRDLLNDLRAYQTTREAKSRADVQEVLRNIEIVTLPAGKPEREWVSWKKRHKRDGGRDGKGDKIIPAYITKPRKKR